MEYLNLYDDKGNLLNEIGIRGKENNNNNLEGIAIIFIQNSRGEFLIQKTSRSRGDEFSTTGGHVLFGSDFLDTIIREVNEELGIDIAKEKIIEANTYVVEHYFQKVYYLRKDINIKDIKVQKSEVDYVRWLSKEEINNLIKNNEFRKGNIEGYKYIINNF